MGSPIEVCLKNYLYTDIVHDLLTLTFSYENHCSGLASKNFPQLCFSRRTVNIVDIGRSQLPGMALFSTFLCFSLVTGSVVFGTIITGLYLLSFILEIWTIFRSELSHPLPSYVLSIGYILMSLFTNIMIISLRYRIEFFIS